MDFGIPLVFSLFIQDLSSFNIPVGAQLRQSTGLLANRFPAYPLPAMACCSQFFGS
jgi:hypothetical protein